MIYLILLVIAVILIIALRVYLNKAQCPECKKRNASRITEKILREEQIYFKEKETIKEYQNTGKYHTDLGMRTASNQYINPPKKIVTREVMVPGTRTWYNVQYKCNKCGKTFSRQEYVDKKTTIVNG